MADNVPITAGSGTTVSTEEVTTLNGGAVSAQHVQRVVKAFRTADATAVDAATGAGAVNTGTQRMTLASDDPAVASLATIASAAADVTTPQPVYGSMKYVDVTLSTDTSAYGSGDLIADTQVVATCVRANDAFGVLASAVVIDEDDQGAAIDLWFLSANNTLGTENSAPSISDANAREILGYVAVAAADYKDLGGVKIASKTGVNLPIKPATGTDDIYVAVVSNGSTPTYTATGLKLRLGFLS